MTVPLVTPLCLASTFVQLTNENSGTLTNIDANRLAAIRWAILSSSMFLTRECGLRRFDEWYEIRPFTCLHERVGGDLLDPYTLQLDTDCRSLISVTNGNGSTISLNIIIPMSNARQVGGVRAINQIRIDQFSGSYWFSAGHDPNLAIQVEARWGYGGQWVDSGTALNQAVLTTDSTISVAQPNKLETGMVLKLTNASNAIEYLYVDGTNPVVNPVPVGRGFNDSAVLAFAGTEKVYYWQPDPSVNQLVFRLAQFYLEQIKSPVFGQIVTGDYSFPVNMQGLPADLFKAVRDLGLVKSAGGVGV